MLITATDTKQKFIFIYYINLYLAITAINGDENEFMYLTAGRYARFKRAFNS